MSAKYSTLMPTFAAAARAVRNWARTPPPWRMSRWLPGDPRRARQQSLVKLLTAGAANQAALAPLVDALAQEQRFGQRATLRTLARRLQSGMPLVDALEQTPGAVSDDAVLAARFGVQSGTLAASLAQRAYRDRTPAVEVQRRLRGIGWYVLGYLAVVALIGAFLMVKIAPSYVEIFSDFDLEVPGPFRWLVSTTRFVEAYVALPALAVVAVVAIWLRVTRGRRLGPVLLSRRKPKTLLIADLWDYLATVAKAGRPFSGAVSTLARYHYDPSIRRQLLFVRNELDYGAELFPSLASVGLATPQEADALTRPAPVAEAAWTLQQLATHRREKYYARVHRRLDLLFPVVVIAVGVLVLFICTAMFTPLVSLTEAMSG